MKIIQHNSFEEFPKKKRSPACQRRNAQRIKDFNRKKKLLAILPQGANEDRNIESLIEKVEIENSRLLEKLDITLNETVALKDRLYDMKRNYERKLRQTRQKRDIRLLELQSIIDENERVIELQLDELQNSNLIVEQQQNDLDYAWNRIGRCEKKIKRLIQQLNILDIFPFDLKRHLDIR